MTNQYFFSYASRNCARAIWAEGTAADIANNYMIACGNLTLKSG